MKNRLLKVTLAAVLISGLLSGCGNGGNTAADPGSSGVVNSEASDDAGNEAAAETDAAADTGSEAVLDTGEKVFTGSGEKIRFAMHPGNGAVAAYRAQKEGYFEELGLDVEIVMFQNGVLINEGFAAGEVEIGINGFAAAYAFATGEYAYLGDVNAQTEYGVYAPADSAAAQESGQVEGLPGVLGTKESAMGMKILAPQGTIAQIVTDAYMARLGLTISDYEIIGMDAGAALTALLAGEGDAAGLFPPYSSQALSAGYVRLASYEEVCGCVPADIFMATNEFMETRYDDAVLLCQAIYQAAAELEADDDVYYKDAMAFFSENGKEYTDNDMRELIETSFFYNEAMLTDPEYEFGYHETYAAKNLIDLGLLTEDTMVYVEESVNTDVIKDALGIDLKVGFYE